MNTTDSQPLNERDRWPQDYETITIRVTGAHMTLWRAMNPGISDEELLDGLLAEKLIAWGIVDREKEIEALCARLQAEWEAEHLQHSE